MPEPQKLTASKHHRDKSVVWGNEQDTAARLIAALIIEELEKVDNQPLTDRQMLRAITRHTPRIEFQTQLKKNVVTKTLDITIDRINMALRYMKSRAWLGCQRVQVKSKQGLLWDYARYLSARYYSHINNQNKILN